MERTYDLAEAGLATLGAGRRIVESAGPGGVDGRGRYVILAHRDPVEFLAGFFSALSEGLDIWLASPSWSAERMEKVAAIAERVRRGNRESRPDGEKSFIFIPTGGTTGRLKFAAHTEETLAASARGFLEFFGCEQGHRTLCVLPPYHVSGLMQAVRASISGGRIYFGDPGDPLSTRNLPDDFNPKGCFISLVPTQLRRLIDGGGSEWLARFGTVIVGGAALDERLASLASEKRIPLSPSYGMTETAALVCALRPDEFLAGETGSGRPLPHAEIAIEPAENSEPRRGIIVIRATSAGVGYADENGYAPRDGPIRTQDFGAIDERGILHVEGRADRTIICGGEKIDASEIEEVLIGSGMVADAVVIGLPDPEWGSVAAAFYVPCEKFSGDEMLAKAIEEKLSRMHVPKIWKKLDIIPRTDAGKPDISILRTNIR